MLAAAALGVSWEDADELEVGALSRTGLLIRTAVAVEVETRKVWQWRMWPTGVAMMLIEVTLRVSQQIMPGEAENAAVPVAVAVAAVMMMMLTIMIALMMILGIVVGAAMMNLKECRLLMLLAEAVWASVVMVLKVNQ